MEYLNRYVLILGIVAILGSHVIGQTICNKDECSVAGVENWSDTANLFCKKTGQCVADEGSSSGSEMTESLKTRFGGQLPVKRSPAQRSFNVQDYENRESEVSCCKMKITVIYPLSGFSAITGDRVTVLQIAAMRQPVVLQECESKLCSFLRGNCTQVYSPIALYVLPENGRRPELDYVLVESGCRCQVDQLARPDGVDDIVKQALHHITGPDFDAEQLIVLPKTDAAPNVQPNISNDQISVEETVEDLATFKPAALAFDKEATYTASGSTSTVKPTTTKGSTTETTKTAIEPSTQMSTAETVTTTTTTTTTIIDTVSTEDSEKITLLPLPPLPPPGQPIMIKPGFFNPAAVFFRPRSKIRAKA